MKRIGVFGASGYLGTYVVAAAEKLGFDVISFVRNEKKLTATHYNNSDIKIVDIRNPHSLKGQLDNCDYVISTVGITRQKDGLSYDDIDYQANLNILREAESAKISKFMYCSVFKGDVFKEVKLCAAKERFVAALKASSIDSCVVRPTGFFSDMAEFLEMAEKGKIHLFGDGQQKINPIHGQDLAETMTTQFKEDTDLFPSPEIPIGGPEIFTYIEIANIAFKTLQKPSRISLHADIIRRSMLILGKLLLPSTFFGPYEFFLTLAATDMAAPMYGSKTLQNFFVDECKK